MSPESADPKRPRKRSEKTAPPAWARTLLRMTLGSAQAAVVIADLDDLYEVRVGRDGAARAHRWYVNQAFSCAWRLSLDRIVRTRPRAPTDGHAPSWLSRSASFVATLPCDMRIATRTLLKRPAYTLTVALTLGLGLSGLSIVYSVANWVLLRPVPGVANPDELTLIQLSLGEGGGPGGRGFPFSHPDAVDLAGRARHLAAFTASTQQELHFAIAGTSNSERISGEFVWSNYFEVLGTTLPYGRTLSYDQKARVAVVSDRLARRFWQRSRDAVGASVLINGNAFTIAGVAPAEFHGTEVPGSSDIWLSESSLPVLLHDPGLLEQPWAQVWSSVIARRTPAATTSELAEAFNASMRMIRKERPQNSFMMPMFEFRAYDGIGLPPQMREEVAHTLNIIAFASLVLLLLTCANVANLGLTRAASTASTSAVRRAMGASGAQIAKERLTESVVLGVVGALICTILTAIALGVLRSTTLMKGGISLEGIHMQLPVLIAATALALAAAAIAGALPAYVATRAHGSTLLRSARHGGVGSNRIRGALVITQMAMSIVLIVWGGLLARTLHNLRNIDFGFQKEGVTVFSIDPELQGYDDTRTLKLMRDLVAGLKAAPDIRTAAITDHGIFTTFTFSAGLMKPGVPEDARDARVNARRVQMSPDLLAVLGIPVIAGRQFDTDWLVRDSAATNVAMLNEAALRKLMPGVRPENAIGRIFTVEDNPRPRAVLITGIAKDARLTSINGQREEQFFQPWSQGWKTGQFTVFVRARDGRSSTAASIRDVMQRLDPTLPVFGMRTLTEQIDEQLAGQRFVGSLALALAGTGVVLAILGLYGTLSYMVLERTREIGVRSALGARPGDLLSDILRNGLALATAGVVIGVCVAVYFSHFIAARLYGVQSFDRVTYIAGSALLLLVAAAASGIPGWRAARVDPVTALRHD